MSSIKVSVRKTMKVVRAKWRQRVGFVCLEGLKSSTSWCPAHSGQGDRANRNSLPTFVLKVIKPVFEALSDEFAVKVYSRWNP